jgi:hypothetical protein
MKMPLLGGMDFPLRHRKILVARYLPPAAPMLRSAPPCVEQWLHEIKFDG